MECILLAGGLGTRLQETVKELPKCMAPVNNLPFLHYVFNYLEQQQVDRVILSLGFKHEYITDWLETQKRSFAVDYVIENERLGTGGGIQLAMNKARAEDVFVLNGDTMFMVDLNEMHEFHKTKTSATTIALKRMFNFDRYGVVNITPEGKIASFEEKQHKNEGLINGGIYLVQKDQFLSRNMPEKFSFEKEYLEAFTNEGLFYGYASEGYFIDIGIPDDYYKANDDFKLMF